MGPFLKKIGCFFHVKRRKKPPDGRLFKGLPLCWCKYTASEGETQMLINVLLDSELGLLRFFHTRLCRRFPAFAGLLRQFQEHLPQLLFVLVARETPAQAGVHTRNVLARCTDQRSGHGTLYSENGELADPTLHPGQMLVTGRQCIIQPRTDLSGNIVHSCPSLCLQPLVIRKFISGCKNTKLVLEIQKRL